MGSDTLSFSYDAGGIPMTVQYKGTTYYYATNIQGDVIAILNTSGAAVVEYAYDAWGSHISTSCSMAATLGTANPLRYRSYIYDADTNLYYLQSRYYNPETGRFLNADAFAVTGQGFLGNSMFTYCLNTPVNALDATGTRCVSILSRLNDVGITSKHAENNTPPVRDVTEEVMETLTKAADTARAHRTVANVLLGDNLCSDGVVYFEFYQLVNHEAPWDIKRQEPWESTIGTPFPGYNVEVVFGDALMTPENLGNFTYGYLGYAYGIPKEHLIAGSYYAAGFPSAGEKLGNEIYDWAYVLTGYELAKQLYRGK